MRGRRADQFASFSRSAARRSPYIANFAAWAIVNLFYTLNYETTENGNAYGDDVRRITGIYCPITGNDSLIFTRTTQDKIVPKRQSADGVSVDVGFSGDNAAPRSAVNNCTRDPAAGAEGLEHADHEVGETVNFDALSRQEKRELVQR